MYNLTDLKNRETRLQSVVEGFGPDRAIKTRRFQRLVTTPGVEITEIPYDELRAIQGVLAHGGEFRFSVQFEHADAQLRRVRDAGFFTTGMETEGNTAHVSAQPSMVVADVTVLGPPGIGDTLWTACKLQTIRDIEHPCRLRYVICAADGKKPSVRSRDFLLSLYDRLRKTPLIDQVEFQNVQLPRDVGCTTAGEPLYSLIANDFLDPGGNMLRDWRPELPTDFDFVLQVPDSALNGVLTRLNGHKTYAAVYLSSNVWNEGVTHGVWTPKDWAQLLVRMNQTGLHPVILGAYWDEYVRKVLGELVDMQLNPVDIVTDMTGKTSLLEAVAVMMTAAVTVGVPSGLPMIPAHFQLPTVILWPVKGHTDPPLKTEFCKEFPYNWVPYDNLYRWLPVGSSEDEIMGAIDDVISRSD